MNSSPDIRETLSVCDKIESLAIESVPESTGVTTFVQEACTAVSAVDPSYSMTYYPVQEKLQDVRDYFARPVCLSAGTVGAVRGSFYSATYSINQLLSSWNNGKERLLGAYGIRFKSVFTLQVAATPFHQGLIVLSHQYGYQNASTFVYRRSLDPSTVTNLPHTVLDLSNDTSIQLHVPFLYVSEYANIRADDPESKFGCIDLSNLVNVPTVSGMGAPTYQLYLHLEDIELFGATPQATSTVTLTAGRKLSPVTEEFEKDSHPFSSALYASSKAVSFIAKGVPSISSIGGPVAWALGKAAGVVRYFGYGKPSITDPVMRNFRQDNVMEYNTDVASGVNVLAITSTNTTSINTMVGASDVDEMSLAYINSRWGQINVFELATSSPAGTLIYATPICPLAFWFRAPSVVPASNIVVRQLSTATSNSIQPSHIMFSASSFKQWRGGLKFRFTFAKTKMHAGRVMVAFNPYLVTRNNTESLTTATGVRVPVYGTIGPDPFGYSAVFDLKDGNVFEFKVPFVCPVPYAALSTITGALAMYVVNPLVASSVVSSTISVVVEVAGDSDFELANPAGVMFPVHNAGTISLTSGRVLSEAPEVMNQLTMGEVVTSVKQLIAVPVVQFVNQPGPNTDVTFYVPPWFYQPAISVVVPAPSTPLPTGSFSYGGNWASCYAFLKGGTDVHVYDVANQYSMALSQLPNPGGFSPNTATPDNRSSSNAPVIFTSRGALHARLPGFFPTARVFSWAANKIAGLGVNWLTTNPFTSGTNVTPLETPQAVYVCKCDNVLPGASALTGGVYVNRNAADDAQLSMYIGPPPIYLPPSSVAGPYDVDSVFIQGA